MLIEKNIDIEDEIRTALTDYITIYCRPLPEDFALPSILVTKVGGTESNGIGSYDVVLDSRAATDAESVDYLNTAIGVLKEIAKAQTCAIRTATINTSGSWGVDPARPELSMSSARLNVKAHLEKVTI